MTRREAPEITKARERLSELVPRAVDTVEDLLDSNNAVAKLNAAREIMDRGGLPARQEHSVVHELDIDSEVESVLARIARAKEVAERGPEAVLGLGQQAGLPSGDIPEPTLFDYDPRSDSFRSATELIDPDNLVVDAEIVEDEGAWWQAAAQTVN